MTYSIEFDMEAKRIRLAEGSERVITTRDNGRSVIDINNSQVSSMFQGITQVVVKIHNDSIVIEPLAEEIKQIEALSKADTKTPTFLEIFSGGGGQREL